MTAPVEVVVAAPVVETPKPQVTAPVSELVQIETVASKVVAVVEPARPAPVNRRRARPLEVYVESEPLVQIETQNPKV